MNIARNLYILLISGLLLALILSLVQNTEPVESTIDTQNQYDVKIPDDMVYNGST